MTKRALLIINPAARTLPSRDRLATASAWPRLHGWQVESVRTSAPLEATSLARRAAVDGVDVVIAAGGDGTVNEVVNGLAGSETALLVIPAGTTNIWTREIRGPQHPGSVAALLEHGQRRRIDLGMAGDRYFLLMASLGLDSAVASMIDPKVKARFGRAAFIIPGVQEALRYRAVRAEITADGLSLRMPLFLLLLGNTRSYGGMLNISHRARAVDGMLDLVAYRAGGMAVEIRQLLRTLVGRHAGKDGAVYRQVREVSVRTDPPVPVQVDGEVFGETPMTFRVAPAVLNVIVPAGPLPPILEAVETAGR